MTAPTGSGAERPAACDTCLRRSWLLARLSGHIDLLRSELDAILTLRNDELIAGLAGKHRGGISDELQSLDLGQLRGLAVEARIESICQCDARYPARLHALDSSPAVLWVAGGIERFLELVGGEPVAVVGARRASAYGLDVARALGRDLARAGMVVVSGMALGVDGAAHAGTLSAVGHPVAVLPSGADRPYPPSKAPLYRRIVAAGAAISELPPGTASRRWTYAARNRIIAGLAAMTVVVEASEESGALLTAASARAANRSVGAVPGRVTTRVAAGTNALLADGATVVRHVQDVLDCIFGVGVRGAPRPHQRPELSPELQLLLAAITDGGDGAAAVTRAGLTPQQGLAALASLELAGYVRREPGGRFTATA